MRIDLCIFNNNKNNCFYVCILTGNDDYINLYIISSNLKIKL